MKRGAGSSGRLVRPARIRELPLARSRNQQVADLEGARLELGSLLKLVEHVAYTETDIRIEWTLGTKPDEPVQSDRDFRDFTDRKEGVLELRLLYAGRVAGAYLTTHRSAPGRSRGGEPQGLCVVLGIELDVPHWRLEV